MIETLVLIVVGAAAICIIILFGCVARVALNRVLYEDKKRIAALADRARLGKDLPVDVDLCLQEISAIAKGDKFEPVIPPAAPQPFPRSTWQPPQ